MVFGLGEADRDASQRKDRDDGDEAENKGFGHWNPQPRRESRIGFSHVRVGAKERYTAEVCVQASNPSRPKVFNAPALT